MFFSDTSRHFGAAFCKGAVQNQFVFLFLFCEETLWWLLHSGWLVVLILTLAAVIYPVKQMWGMGRGNDSV